MKKPVQKSKEQTKQQTFIARIADILSVDRTRIPQILVNFPLKAARRNALKTNRSMTEIIDEVKQLGIKPQPLTWYPDAFLFPAYRTNELAASHLVLQGALFIQNPSSFLPVLALEPSRGDSFLDICSAPGGKGAHFAALVHNDGEFVLNDFDTRRLQKLRHLIDLLGVRSDAKITTFDGRRIVAELTGQLFDKILLDAECSTEATVNFLARNPMVGWSLEEIERLSHLQAKMITQAYDLLRPGGVLVYSTCTFAPEENEQTISRLLKRRPEALVQQLTFDAEKTAPIITQWQGTSYHPEVVKCLRIFPSEYMEGFFISRIVKPTGDTAQDERLSKVTVDLDSLAQKYAVAAP
jgi:16S rRNA (cytosine1407-C5)-methyltransferase